MICVPHDAGQVVLVVVVVVLMMRMMSAGLHLLVRGGCSLSSDRGGCNGRIVQVQIRRVVVVVGGRGVGSPRRRRRGRHVIATHCAASLRGRRRVMLHYSDDWRIHFRVTGRV